MEEKNIITQQGLKELKAEIKELIEVERPKVIQDIKEAREQGDLSENAEFDAAREKQGQIEDRITEIERIISDSKVINASRKAADKVRIGSTVTIEMKGKKSTYTIVGALESDPFKGKISNISPLGSALLNAEPKSEVQYVVETKSGVKNKLKVKIISVKNN